MFQSELYSLRLDGAQGLDSADEGAALSYDPVGEFEVSPSRILVARLCISSGAAACLADQRCGSEDLAAGGTRDRARFELR
jgi:hypothetical protein